MSLYIAALLFPQYDAAPTVFHCSDARLWALPGLLQTWHLAFKQKTSIFVSSPQRNLFLVVSESFRCPLPHPLQMLSIHTMGIIAEIQSGCLCQTCGRLSYAFYWGLATLPNKPDCWIDSSLILPWFLRLPRLPGGCKCLPFMDHGGQWSHYWDLQCSKSFPQICFLMHSCLWGLKSIPWTSWLGLCSNTHCQLWCLV